MPLQTLKPKRKSTTSEKLLSQIKMRVSNAEIMIFDEEKNYKKIPVTPKIINLAKSEILSENNQKISNFHNTLQTLEYDLDNDNFIKKNLKRSSCLSTKETIKDLYINDKKLRNEYKMKLKGKLSYVEYQKALNTHKNVRPQGSTIKFSVNNEKYSKFTWKIEVNNKLHKITMVYYGDKYKIFNNCKLVKEKYFDKNEDMSEKKSNKSLKTDKTIIEKIVVEDKNKNVKEFVIIQDKISKIGCRRSFKLLINGISYHDICKIQEVIEKHGIFHKENSKSCRLFENKEVNLNAKKMDSRETS